MQIYIEKFQKNFLQAKTTASIRSIKTSKAQVYRESYSLLKI